MAKVQIRNTISLCIFVTASVLAATPGCRHSSVGSDEAKQNESSDDAPQVTIATRPVETHSIGQTISVLGQCGALPSKRAVLTPVIEGQVTELLVQQGDKVAAGQPIVQLSTTLTQADLAEKQAARDSLVASLEVLKSPPRTQEKRISELAIEQADLAVTRAQALVERLLPLRERNEIPESQLFEAKEALKQAQSQQHTTQVQLDLLVLTPKKEILAEAESKIKVADEAIKTAQARLDLQTIRAPISGVVDTLTARPGQTVSVGTVIGEVLDTEKVVAMAWLSTAQSSSIHVGQNANVYVDQAAPVTADSSKTAPRCSGSVTYVGKSADRQTGNVPVHILVANSHDELVIGQTLHIEVVVEEPAPQLCVPIEAVHDEGDGPAVTVIRDGKATIVHPTLGASDAGWTVVSDCDLKEGELVAVAGGYNLPDDTPVKVLPEKSAKKSER
jgi:HlyD family secretion protein